jgi:hypothetical protein
MDTSRFQWWHIPVAIAAAAIVIAVLFPELYRGAFSGEDTLSELANDPIDGSFRSTGKTLGTWNLVPNGCLDGQERGFEGIVFVFAGGDPIEDIRIDTSRDGDNVVEVRLADQEGTKLRAREGQCRTISGSITRTNVTYNGRPMRRLKGTTRIDCPTLGLTGETRFSGCLPIDLE